VRWLLLGRREPAPPPVVLRESARSPGPGEA
jgi:hypothetical protein